MPCAIYSCHYIFAHKNFLINPAIEPFISDSLLFSLQIILKNFDRNTDKEYGLEFLKMAVAYYFSIKQYSYGN